MDLRHTGDIYCLGPDLESFCIGDYSTLLRRPTPAEKVLVDCIMGEAVMNVIAVALFCSMGS